MYVRYRRLRAYLTRTPANWGGPHMGASTLDQLAEYVTSGLVQSVVDQVYTDMDVGAAMEHVCSSESIGSTIITLRS